MKPLALSGLINLSLGRIVALGALSAAALATAALPATAQVMPGSIPGVENVFDSSMFSQDLTDAVTQGFRQRDRVFFEEGVADFESTIDELQDDGQAEPVLNIEPVMNDWAQLEATPTAE